MPSHPSHANLPPVPPPLVVWNPHSHREEIMAVFNVTSGTYEAVPEGMAAPSGARLGVSYGYEWNPTTGTYEYVMTRDTPSG